MVSSFEAEGMSTGQILVDQNIEEESTADDTSKRGRGRPPGATNKNTELIELKASIEELTNKVNKLENSSSQPVQATPVSSSGLEQRLDVLQTWIEAFHMFLCSGRITNSAERAAEDELDKILEQLPEMTQDIYTKYGVNAES